MIRLTQTVQKGGCAAKVAASELRKILAEVRFPKKPKELLIDGSLFDDAAIFKISEELALVQTLDFFTPIVDSPKIFGKIAAANALSDVYAMGGVPETAMAILAFPLATMEKEVVVDVLQGACDLLAEANVSLVGGHSIDDDTLKFGLSVTGKVHPQKIWSNAGARVGDLLILTKALGTGTLTAALKRSAITEEQMPDVLASMAQLNRVPEILPKPINIHAATDITGFGIAGHAMQMAKASQKSFVIDFYKLPVFAQAWKSLKDGFLTKAHRSNADYTREHLHWDAAAVDDERLIMFDPQTSGGILLAVDPQDAATIVEVLRKDFPCTTIIGEVLPYSEYALKIR